MTTLHVKSPNGTQKDIDIDKIFTTDGGTMTGAIICSTRLLAARPVNDDYLLIYGGTTFTDGSYLALTGSNFTGSGGPGNFALTAVSSSGDNITLFGKSDGTLTWANKEVICEMAKSLSTKSGYCKLNNGLLLQYGTVGVTASPYTLTFPIAWSSEGSYAMSICHAGTAPSRVSYSRINNSQAKLYLDYTGDTFWIAIGY